jgi:hypothetical protein
MRSRFVHASGFGSGPRVVRDPLVIGPADPARDGQHVEVGQGHWSFLASASAMTPSAVFTCA